MIIQIFFILLVSFDKCRSDSAKPITVETPRGPVVGFQESYKPNFISNHSASGKIFLGIPFALPPKRFKKAEPLLKYATSPLKATKLAPACIQSGTEYKVEMSEDCLFLNVLTPSTGGHFPVMVYIHGGSLRGGSAQEFGHEGLIRNLVRHGVVVVVIQFRVGALGFFNTGTDDFPGNLGMLDQVEALKWVQSEISSFGGDPKRVTIFGSSAGAACVSAHTYSPLSQGLFHSAIMQSGSILTCLDGAIGSDDPSRKFAATMCSKVTASDWESGNFTQLHECLDTMEADLLTSKDMEYLTGWKIVQDPVFLPSTPLKLAPSRRNVPVLMGSMKDEFHIFISKFIEGMEEGFLKRMYIKYIDLPRAAGKVIENEIQLAKLVPLLEKAYANVTGRFQKVSEAVSAGAFIAPIQRDIRDWMKNGNYDIFIYEMTHPSHVIGFKETLQNNGWDPAVHTGELPYISANAPEWKKAMENKWATPYDFALMEWMGQAWTKFAKTGKPDASWHPVSSISYRLPYLEISSTGRSMKIGYRSKDEFFWNVQVPEVLGELPKERKMKSP